MIQQSVNKSEQLTNKLTKPSEKWHNSFNVFFIISLIVISIIQQSPSFNSSVIISSTRDYLPRLLFWHFTDLRLYQSHRLIFLVFDKSLSIFARFCLVSLLDSDPVSRYLYFLLWNTKIKFLTRFRMCSQTWISFTECFYFIHKPTFLNLITGKLDLEWIILHLRPMRKG